MSNSLRPHGLQQARLSCPSPTPGACSNSCPLSQWCHSAISSSVVPFSSHLQSFPASGYFPVGQFFASGSQNIGISASASVLPVNIQDWFPLGLTGLNCYQYNNPLSHRLYDRRARVNAAILSMSKLRFKEGCGLVEVSQIGAEEDANTVITKGWESRRLWFKGVHPQMDELGATQAQSVQPGQKDSDRWPAAEGRSREEQVSPNR